MEAGLHATKKTAEKKMYVRMRGDFRRLTFDMSGGAKGAKRPVGRPLDGGVRRHGGSVGTSSHALYRFVSVRTR